VDAALARRDAELRSQTERRLREQRKVADRDHLHVRHLSELFDRRRERPEVAAVRGHEHDPLEAVARPAAHDVRDDAVEGLLLDRHRAREGEVVLRATHAHGGRVERVQALGERAPQLVPEDGVGAQR
jgi:hypothetical protein